MAIRLSCTFFSNENETSYTIEIHDAAYSGSVIDFRTDDKGFEISYSGEKQQLRAPILTSKCDVNIYVENQDIQDLIDDLNSAYEGQFRLLISTSSAERWVGIILPDLVKYEDKPFAILPIFRVTATDGIKRLQTIAYKDTSGPYSGSKSVVEHLSNIVGKIGTADLITTNAWAMVVATNWKPASIKAGDVMANTYFEHRALYQVDDKGEYKYSSVYRVLEQLCLVFHCQFKMVNGSFFFTQHNYHESSSFTTYLYTAAGSLVISGSLAMDNTVSTLFTEKYAGGFYSFFPALNYAQVNYVHMGFSNIAQGYIWDHTDQPTIPESPTSYDVSDGTGFLVSSNFYYSLVVTGNRPAFMKFNITLQVDTNYLKRTTSFTGFGATTEQAQEISATVANYELIIPVDVTVPGSPSQFLGSGNIPISFQTIPFSTGGDVSFTISYVGSYDTTGTIVSSGIIGLNWSFFNLQLSPLPGGELSQWSNTRKVIGINATSGNTEKRVINSVIGQEFGYGVLKIDDGSVFIDGVDWGLGATASQSLEVLLTKEIIRTQSVPIKTLRATIKMSMTNIHQTMVHNSNRWILHKGKFTGNLDQMAGEWYLLDTTGTTSSSEELDEIIGAIDNEGNDINTQIPVIEGSTPVINAPPGQSETTSVLDALFPRTTADIDEASTVTTIPITARTVDGEYKVGQIVTIINQFTGAQQDFTITTESQTSDTVLNVTSDTADFFFTEGSWIVTSQEQTLSSGGSTAFYREEFTTHASTTITVTENSGNLPTNAAAIRVYYDTGQLISKNYWSHSGSVITLTFTPPGQQSIWVEFNV